MAIRGPNTHEVRIVRVLIAEHRRWAEVHLMRLACGSPGLQMDRKFLVRDFIATGSYAHTARLNGISAACVRYLMAIVVRELRAIGGIPPLATGVAATASVAPRAWRVRWLPLSPRTVMNWDPERSSASTPHT